MIDTQSRRALVAWMRANPLRTQVWLGEKLGVYQTAVSRWVRGSARPEAHLRPLLEKLSDGHVSEAGWLTSQERVAVKQATKRIENKKSRLKE